MLNDANLSWKAKGLFVYLWSQADEWNFYETEVVKHSTDGIRSMRSGIHELEENGYLTRKRDRIGNRLKGSIWLLSETPQKLHNYKRGSEPSFKNMCRIADALDVSLDYFRKEESQWKN